MLVAYMNLCDPLGEEGGELFFCLFFTLTLIVERTLHWSLDPKIHHFDI